MVVLAGYETVREALVNRAEEFGDREISPIFYDMNQGHGTGLLRVSSNKAWHFSFFTFKAMFEKFIDIFVIIRDFVCKWRLLERNETFRPDDTERLWDGKKTGRGENIGGMPLSDQDV